MSNQTPAPSPAFPPPSPLNSVNPTPEDCRDAFIAILMHRLAEEARREGQTSDSISMTVPRQAAAAWETLTENQKMNPFPAADEWLHSDSPLRRGILPDRAPDPEPEISDIARRLKTAREAAGLSQRALALTAGVQNSQVSRIEAGAVIPELSTAAALAKALGLSISELTGVTGATGTEPPAPAAVDACGATALIAFDRLFASPLNPRRRMDPERVAELAASICNQGLLQSLTGRSAAEGRIEVFIGGTRYAALAKLMADDAWPEDRLPGRLVEVKIVNVDDLTLLRMAVAENVNRADMHPLDEGAAFAAMLDHDSDTSFSAIAAAYGKTKRWVEERVRVARALAPEMADAFQQDKMRWDQARALSRFPAAAQLILIKNHPDLLEMTSAEAVDEIKNVYPPVSAALFAADAYTAAGGEILPAEDDDEARFADPELFTRLQRAEIDKRLKGAAEKGWWTEEVHGKPSWWRPSNEIGLRQSDQAEDGCGMIVSICGADLRRVKFFENVIPDPKDPLLLLEDDLKGRRLENEDQKRRDPVEAVGPARRIAAAKIKIGALQTAMSASPPAKNGDKAQQVAAARTCLALLGWEAASRIRVDMDWRDDAALSPALAEKLDDWREKLGPEWFDDGTAAATPNLAAGWRMLRLRFAPLIGSYGGRYHSYVPEPAAARGVFSELLKLKTADLHRLIADLTAARTRTAWAESLGDDWLTVDTAAALNLDMEDHWTIDSDYMALLKGPDLEPLKERVNAWCASNRKPLISDEEWSGMKTVATKRATISVHVHSCRVKLIPPEIDIAGHDSTMDRLRDWG